MLRERGRWGGCVCDVVKINQLFDVRRSPVLNFDSHWICRAAVGRPIWSVLWRLYFIIDNMSVALSRLTAARRFVIDAIIDFLPSVRSVGFYFVVDQHQPPTSSSSSSAAAAAATAVPAAADDINDDALRLLRLWLRLSF